MRKEFFIIKHHFLQSDKKKRQEKLQSRIQEFLKIKKGEQADEVCHILPSQ
ncbi:MAG: hypothetical protein ACOX05_05235 [Bacillota bacterium]|jgi:hypothetical protein